MALNLKKQLKKITKQTKQKAQEEERRGNKPSASPSKTQPKSQSTSNPPNKTVQHINDNYRKAGGSKEDTVSQSLATTASKVKEDFQTRRIKNLNQRIKDSDSEKQKEQLRTERDKVKQRRDETKENRTTRQEGERAARKKGYDTMDSNEILLYQTLGLAGGGDNRIKTGMESAETTLRDESKITDERLKNTYSNMGKKLASGTEYSYNAGAGTMGFLNGVNFVPVSLFNATQRQTGETLDRRGYDSGAYMGGEMLGAIGTGLVTGQGLKTALDGGLKIGSKVINPTSKLGQFALHGIGNAIADSPINALMAREASDKAVAESTKMTEGLEGGGNGLNSSYYNKNEDTWAEPDANGKNGEMNNPFSYKGKEKWNEDLYNFVMNKYADKDGNLPENIQFKQDKNGMLHYSASGHIDDVIAYYDNAENPTYTLEGNRYTEEAGAGKEFALYSGMSAGIGGGLKALGRGGKQATEEVVEKATKEVPKETPKVKTKEKPKKAPKQEEKPVVKEKVEEPVKKPEKTTEVAEKPKEPLKTEVKTKQSVKVETAKDKIPAKEKSDDFFLQTAEEERKHGLAVKKADKAAELAEKGKKATSDESSAMSDFHKQDVKVNENYSKVKEAKIQEVEEYIKNYEKKGADIVRDFDQNTSINGGTPTQGRTYKVSQNEPWYREFYAKNGRSPYKKEIRELAEKIVNEAENGTTGKIDVDFKDLVDARTNASDYATALNDYHQQYYPNYSDAEFELLKRTGLEKSEWTPEMKKALKTDSSTKINVKTSKKVTPKLQGTPNKAQEEVLNKYFYKGERVSDEINDAIGSIRQETKDEMEKAVKETGKVPQELKDKAIKEWTDRWGDRTSADFIKKGTDEYVNFLEEYESKAIKAKPSVSELQKKTPEKTPVESQNQNKIGGFEVTGSGKPNANNLGAISKDFLDADKQMGKVRGAAKKAKHLLISGQDTLERMSKQMNSTRTIDKVQAYRAAQNSVSYAFNKGVVSAKQSKIINNKGLKDVLGAVPKEDLSKFNEFALHTHNIDRARQFTFTIESKNGAKKSVQAGNWADATKEFDKKYGIKLPDVSKYDQSLGMSKEEWDKIANLTFDSESAKMGNVEVKSKAVWRGITSEDSSAWLKDMFSEDEIERFTKYQQDINKWWKDFTYVNYVESGVLSEKEWKTMQKMYPNYVPTFRVDKEMYKGVGVKGATGGHSAVRPIEDSFVEEMQRIVKQARKNEMLTSFYKDIAENPDELSMYGRITSVEPSEIDYPELFLDDWEKNAISEIKNDKALITTRVNGNKITMSVSKDIAENFKLLDDAYGWNGLRTFGEAGKIVSDKLKEGITGVNPLFGLYNIARDMPTAIVQSEFSVPKTISGWVKAAGGMTGASKDMKKLYELYKAMGGKEAGYFHQGKGFTDIIQTEKNPYRKAKKFIKDTLSFIGETGETLPRLGEFINTLETYGVNEEGLAKALHNSAEVTVNFSRSAPITKAADGWVLYLNAAVQGIDKFARTVKAHPVRTTARSVGMITAPALMLTAYNWDNPHYQDLSDRIKMNYFVLPNIRGEKDADGNCKTFIKIPFNREYGTIFASSMNLAFAQFKGGDTESLKKQLGEAVKTNFAPPNPIKDNILSPFAINLPSNKDFADRDIIPYNLQKVEPRLQYDATTSDLAMKVADMANKAFPEKTPKWAEAFKSPMKVDYLIDSYGGYYGSVLQAINSPKDFANLKNYMVDTGKGQVEPYRQKFIADPLYSSQPVNNFYEAKEKAEIDYNTKKLEDPNNAELEKKVNSLYTSNSKTMSEFGKAEKPLKGYNKLSGDEKREAIVNALNIIEKSENPLLSKKEMKKFKKDAESLSDDDIKRITDGLRTAKNDFAKSAMQDVEKTAKEYKDHPTYATLPKAAQDGYKKKYGTKEQYAKTYNKINKTTEDGKDYYSAAAKAAVAIKNGMDFDATYDLTGSTSNKTKYAQASYAKGQYIANSGINIKKAASYKGKADSDSDGYVKADEAVAYINSMKNLSQAEKRAYFYVLCSSWNAKSPY